MPKQDTIIWIVPEDDEKKGRRKGIIWPEFRPEDLARRLIDPRINFWDLAMVSTGPGPTDYEMLDFQPTLPDWFGDPTDYSDRFLELEAKLFEVPVEQWRTHYKKITPAMDYGLHVGYFHPTFGYSTTDTLDSSDPDFTDAGWDAPDFIFESPYVPAIMPSQPLLINPVPLGEKSGIDGNKITSVYDITAPAVAFTPSKRMDVFLVPALPFLRGSVDYFIDYACPQPPSLPTEEFWHSRLNEFWSLFPRSINLDPADEFYKAGGAGIVTQLVFDEFGSVTPCLAEAPGATAARWEVIHALNERLKTHANARGWYEKTGVGGFTYEDAGTDFQSGMTAEFPYTFGAGGLWVFGASGGYWHSGNARFHDDAQYLRCVIYQNGQYYYVWNADNAP